MTPQDTNQAEMAGVDQPDEAGKMQPSAGTPQGRANQGEPMNLQEYTDILEEIENQPREWRLTADREMDYADGNQLETELLAAQKKLGIPPAMEDMIGPTLEAIRGYEVSVRTDWRVTPNGQAGGQDVAEAINFKLNQAERHSRADRACSDAFRPQIGVGLGWVEVSRESDPFKFPYRCRAIHRNEIHWDMSGGSSDPDEWRYMRRQRWLHPSRLALVFPDHKELIDAFGRGPSWWMEPADQTDGISTGLRNAWNTARSWTVKEDRYYNPTSRDVCLSELWYRRWVDVGVLKSPDGRVVEYDAGNETHNYAIATGRAKYSRAVVARVRRAYWLGPHLLDDTPSPYAHHHFPYVPFFGFMEDSTAVPFGYVRGLIYQQDTINSGSAKLRWGMSATRTERTKGAVAMTDEQFRRTVGRLDADIVLDANHMAQSGARFEVKRDFQLSQTQLDLLENARAAISRIAPAAAGAFSGRPGTARSGVQEATQVEQANQSLASMMDSFRTARMRVGEMLMSMIVEDIGSEPYQVVVEGDAVRDDRVIQLNSPELDPDTGMAYLSNDLLRTRLMVALEEVPSTSSYRSQQLNAMSEAVKALPPQYQAAAMPFLASLMDTPFKRELVEALRAAGEQQSPDQIEERIKTEVANALKMAGNDLKARELDMKERVSDAQIKEIMARAVQVGVQAAYSAMQAGAQVAMNPAIAPVADTIMQASGYQEPTPRGVDPNLVPEATMPVQTADSQAAQQLGEARQNTSPQFPPVPRQAPSGAQGIETPSTADNLPPG